MFNNKYLFFITLLVLLTLLIRDLPYVNVAIIGRMWIVYLLILLVVILTSLRFKYTLVLGATYFLFLIALTFTLLSIPFIADAIGVLVYFSLWILFCHDLITTLRKK